PTRQRSTGSVRSVTPSSWIRVVACPSQVIVSTSPSCFHRMTDVRPPTDEGTDGAYGQIAAWQPEAPRFNIVHLVSSWLVAAASVMVAALVLPGLSITSFGKAIVAAAVIAVLNALLPPIVAALRLPFTLLLGFVLVLCLDALILVLA